MTTVLLAVVNLIFLSDMLRAKMGHHAGTGTAVDPGRPTLTAAILSLEVSDDEDLTVGSGSGVYLDSGESGQAHDTELTHTIREDNRVSRQMSCCTVGKMAAVQDLHCLAQYHVDKLKLREQPEVTHHKLGNHRTRQQGRLPPHMNRDFRRCVAERPLLFEKCCYGHASTKNDKLRWLNHRKTKAGSLQRNYLSWRYIYS